MGLLKFLRRSRKPGRDLYGPRQSVFAQVWQSLKNRFSRKRREEKARDMNRLMEAELARQRDEYLKDRMDRVNEERVIAEVMNIWREDEKDDIDLSEAIVKDIRFVLDENIFNIRDARKNKSQVPVEAIVEDIAALFVEDSDESDEDKEFDVIEAQFDAFMERFFARTGVDRAEYERKVAILEQEQLAKYDDNNNDNGDDDMAFYLEQIRAFA